MHNIFIFMSYMYIMSEYNVLMFILFVGYKHYCKCFMLNKFIISAFFSLENPLFSLEKKYINFVPKLVNRPAVLLSVRMCVRVCVRMCVRACVRTYDCYVSCKCISS